MKVHFATDLKAIDKSKVLVCSFVISIFLEQIELAKRSDVGPLRDVDWVNDSFWSFDPSWVEKQALSDLSSKVRTEPALCLWACSEELIELNLS